MTSPAADLPLLSFGAFVLDLANARLTQDGRALDVPPKDLDVLAFLAQRAGRLVGKDELLDAVWQHRFVSDSVLATVVSRLRSLLGDSAREPRYIETAPRRGYRFIASVSSAAAAAPAATPAPPAVSSGASASTLIGRGPALAWLQRQLETVMAGKTRVALLAGEAGIGKSSLIEAFTRSLVDSRVAVAHGQCVEHNGPVEPYLPVLEALNGLCRSLPEVPLPELMHQVAPTWLVQLPWIVAAEDRLPLQQEVAGSGQDRMLREFGELLERLSALQPLVLVLEDLHWSDAASVQLIGYLARRRASARVLVLGSLRPAEIIVSEHPLKATRNELRQQRLCDEIDLELFSESDAAHYLQQHLADAACSETLVRELHQHTGGLPLFLAAVVDELQGAPGDPAGADLTARVQQLQQVPRSIFGLIEQQHARLPEPVRQWLTAASVCGVEFMHTVLADALRIDAAELQSSFDALVRSRSWLRSAGADALPDGRVGVRYAFTHAVHRNVLYELVGDARRVVTHRQLAAALLQVYGGDIDAVAAEAALHFEKGQDPGRAVQHLALAARRALHRFVAKDAVAIAERALALLATLPDRDALRDTELALQVTLGVAEAQRLGVMSSESRGAFGRTVGLMGDLRHAPARVPAMHGLWWATLARGDMRHASEMATQALTRAAEREDPLLRFAGHAALGITLVHVGDLPQAEHHLLQALQGHRESGDELPAAMFSFDPGVQLTSYLAMCLWMQGRPAQATLQLQQASRRAETLRQPMTRVLALHFEATLHSLAGDFRQARITVEHALRLIEEHKLQRAAGAYRWLHGRTLVEAGDVDAGLALMRQGRAQQERFGLRYGLTRWHHSYGQANLQLGHLDAAEAAVSEGLALAHSDGEMAAVPDLHLVQGELQRARGQTDRAAESIERAVAVAREQGALTAELNGMHAWSQLKGAGTECLGLSLQQVEQRRRITP